MTRPPLFATRISISNFRGYAAFDLELPATPCIVLLSGPNGLGKTTLFEAIEWALTARVRRLDTLSRGKAHARDLVRHATDVDSFGVKLSFRDADGNEERVGRSQVVPERGTDPESVGTAVSDVAKLLAVDDDRWQTSASNLSDYLHLTHFHTQVAFLRFVSNDPKMRWLRVSPLAGVDRFDRVRTNLTNSKAALSRLGDDWRGVLAAAIQRNDVWLSMLSRRSRVTNLAAVASDALAPTDVARDILAGVAAVDLEVPRSLDAPSADADSTSAFLRAAQSELEKRRASLKSQQALLPDLRAILRKMLDVEAQLQSREGQVARLESEEGARQTAVEQARRARDSAHQEAQAREGERLTAALHHERFTILLRDREELRRTQAEADGIEQELASLLTLFEAAEQALTVARQKAQQLASLRGAIAAHRQRLSEIKSAGAVLDEIELQQQQETRAASELVVARDAAEGIEAKASAVDAALTAKSDEVASLEDQQDQANAAFDEAKAALSTLARHIDASHQQCPLCQSQFPPGELRRAVERSLAAVAPSIAALANRLALVQSELDALQLARVVLAGDLRRAKADELLAEELLGKVRKRIRLLRATPTVVDVASDSAREELRALHTHEETSLRTQESAIAEMQAFAEDWPERVRVAELSTAEHRNSIATSRERLRGRLARASEIDARISLAIRTHPELGEVAAQSELLTQLADRVASTRENAATALASLKRADVEMEALTRSLASIAEDRGKWTAEVSLLKQRVADLQRQWRDSRLPEPPGEDVIEVAGTEIARKLRECDALGEKIASLGTSLNRWRELTELQQLEIEISEARGERSEDAHSDALRRGIADSRLNLDKAERARAAADQLSDALQGRSSEFGTRALQPFGELFRRYIRGLIHDDRFHGIRLTYNPTARQAGLRFNVELGPSGDRDAELVLSEGQLGEVSLAAMLAASSAFPWSRWKALLLDDPTQYNDLIHSTSFYDVLRNLARDGGYQVIVSTHDNEQAGFLRRKAASLGVPCVECRYTANTDAGISAHIDAGQVTSPDNG